MYIAAVALLFLLRLRFGCNTTVQDVIRRNHGHNVLRQFYKLLDTQKKHLKCNLDIEYLIKCKTYNIFPKFLRFKLYKKCLQRSKFYKSCQSKLLNEEIKYKRSCSSKLSSQILDFSKTLKSKVSILEFAFIKNYTNHHLEVFRDKTKTVHDNKLKKLGIDNELEPCNPENVIFNFSSKSISARLKILLSFGLDFGLPVYKLDFYEYFLSFERLASILKNHTVATPFTFNEVKKSLHTLSYKYFYGFKPFKVFSSVFSKADVNAIKSFASDKSIIVSKPDKGKAVVIQDRDDYKRKMDSILSDSSKFKTVPTTISQTITKLEDKINRFLSKLKKLEMISDSIYNELFVSGSLPGVLYGLPKIHKIGIPLRPIFAACSTPAYKLAKFLVPILSPLTTNDYTLNNSYEFVETLKGFNNCNDLYMVSYDVESLFTNIPLYETIDICLNSLFTSCTHVIGITKQLFKTLLELSVLNSYFVFNDKFYFQCEGVGMGLPLGPTFANAFMCYHESKWLADCPSEFRPLLYKRYVDDSFVLFRSRSHADKFLDYVNNKHPNIKFTMETEKDGQLAFLDVNVRKTLGKFETSVYRKPTFTGLGLSFFSFSSFRFKKSSITTLLHRAYRICSNYNVLHKEFNFVKLFFKNNGFPNQLVEFSVRNFLCGVFSPKDLVPTVPKLKQYFVFPFFGVQSEKLKQELTSLLTKFYPHIDPSIILVNRFKIGSFFRFKDRIPVGCQSSVVYNFSCASCDASYIGSTKRALYSRVLQHQGRSFRTGLPITRPDPSAIRTHFETCKTDFSLENFKVIGKVNNILDLRILESLHIFKRRPNLNNNASAMPLNVI